VAISLLLARWLTTENRERNAIHDLLVAQAAGDAHGMLDHLEDCDAACQKVVGENARRLERPGDVKILLLQSGTSYALGSATGLTRVAWSTVEDDSLPVVQCVEVPRGGNALTGRTVTLRSISAPIGNEASC
jgi:hypothetical protein